MIFNYLRVTPAELNSYLEDSGLLENRVYENEGDDPNLVDIDKSWEGILFLLTGQNLENATAPLTRVLLSGQELDPEQDMGYGPAHYLTPEQVRELNTEIAAISVEELHKRYDPAKMKALEIYPNVWENEEEVHYLTEYFADIQTVFATAAKNGEAIITFIN